MIQVFVFFLGIVISLGFAPLRLYAAQASSTTEAASSSNLIQPNVTIDLDPPQGTKTVIPAKPKPASKEGEANIFLNFENASVLSVLNYLAEEKKINLFCHPIETKDLAEKKLTLSTRSPLTLDRAWNILLTILDLSGYTINEVKGKDEDRGLHRVIANTTNAKEPLPFYLSKTTQPEDLPDDNSVIRYAYFLSNIKVDIAASIIAPMLEGEGAVMPNADLQVVIIKEKSNSVKAVMKIIKSLDSGGLRESIKIIRLQEAEATTIGKLLEEIIGSADKDKGLRFAATTKKKDTTYFSSSTKVIPYAAKNALILLGTEENINKIVDFVYKNLDVPIGTAASRLHIKEIRYGKAEDFKKIIDPIIKPPGAGSDKSAAGRYKFFEDVIIFAESASATKQGRGGGNRLVISCNEDDWKRLDDFIDSIDKPQPQVALEIMLVSLTEAQNKELGTQLQSKVGHEIGMGINRANFNNLSKAFKTTPNSAAKAIDPQDYIQLAADPSTDPKSGLKIGDPSMMTLGKINSDGTNTIWALIRSVLNIANTQIISQPYLIANNHSENCEIKLGETRRLPGALTGKGGEPQKSAKESVEALTSVIVLPDINADGVVDLTINITIDSFIETGNKDTPASETRNIFTKSSMVAGEVLVLGGFKVSRQEITMAHTPLLSSIPIIGNLFRNKTKGKTENYLYVFIRPSIIKPQFEGAADEYTQLKLDYAKYQMIRNDTYAKNRDPIQRWFFKPTNYTIKQKLNESRLGVFAPIDDFAYGKGQPKSVNIKGDPYFKVSEAIVQQRQKLKQRKVTERLERAVEEAIDKKA